MEIKNILKKSGLEIGKEFGMAISVFAIAGSFAYLMFVVLITNPGNLIHADSYTLGWFFGVLGTVFAAWFIGGIIKMLKKGEESEEG